MATAATISADALSRITNAAYVGNNYEVALVDSPGTTFGADDPFATVLAGEVQAGLGGYTRQTIGFVPTDEGTFADGKIELARKAAQFTHDGTPSEVIRFSHVVLISPGGTEIESVAKLAKRTALSDGQTAIYFFDVTVYGVFVAS